MKYIDHTLLKPVATWDEIKKICEEGLEHSTASVCIPPSYVARAKEAFPELNVCTVIGFPLGYNTTEVKLMETKQALEDGASEIDMVINIGDVKNQDFDKVQKEIALLKEAVGNDKILKVIVETCYLTEEEKVKLCQCVTDAGADYIKTSTGFGTNGATVEDIVLFKENIGENVKMKASGGVRTKEDVETFAELGCSRIGTSSAVKILK